MAIEVKQMVVKTEVVQRLAGPEHLANQSQPAPDLRKLLNECRRMLQDLLRERRER